jgi:hypothetical protein
MGNSIGVAHDPSVAEDGATSPRFLFVPETW